MNYFSLNRPFHKVYSKGSLTLFLMDWGKGVEARKQRTLSLLFTVNFLGV